MRHKKVYTTVYSIAKVTSSYIFLHWWYSIL